MMSRFCVICTSQKDGSDDSGADDGAEDDHVHGGADGVAAVDFGSRRVEQKP